MRRILESRCEESCKTGGEETEKLSVIRDEVKDTNMKIFTMIVEMQKNIQIIRRSLPRQIERQQPVYFIDACGFHTPFHLEFIDCWEAFDAVLEIRFRDKGLRKIQRREYVLERGSDGKAIERHTPWNRCFSPGMQLTMDMLFKESNHATNTCPACGQESYEATDSGVDW
jgi:ubiquitin domain-containing protein